MFGLLIRHENAWSENDLSAFRHLPIVHHVEHHEPVSGGFAVAILYVATEEDVRLLRHMVSLAVAARRDFVAEYLH